MYGVKTIYIPSNNSNISRVEIVIKAGNCVEKDNELGLSHLLEHMIAETWNEEPWINKGIIFNANTGINIVRYYITGSNKYLNEMIKSVYDITLSPDFVSVSDPKTVSKLKKSKLAVKQELSGFCNNPIWLINNKMYNIVSDKLISSEPGIHNTGDWDLKLKLLDSYTIDDIINFHKKWYKPENMLCVIVSSNCEHPQWKNELKLNYQTKEMKMYKIKENIQVKNNTKYVINKVNTDLKMNNVIVTYVSEITKDSDILLYTDIVSKLLCGDMSSIMYKKLRNELHLVYSIQLTYERINNILVSNFDFSCSDDKVNTVLEHFFDILYSIESIKELDKLIEIAKEKIYIELVEHCKNLDFLSYYYGQLFTFNDNKIEHHKIPSMIKNVSTDKIIKVLNHIINKKTMFVCVQGPV